MKIRLSCEFTYLWEHFARLMTSVSTFISKRKSSSLSVVLSTYTSVNLTINFSRLSFISWEIQPENCETRLVDNEFVHFAFQHVSSSTIPQRHLFIFWFVIIQDFDPYNATWNANVTITLVFVLLIIFRFEFFLKTNSLNWPDFQNFARFSDDGVWCRLSAQIVLGD